MKHQSLPVSDPVLPSLARRSRLVLIVEGIEPNPGPRRRLPAGTRRVKVWCLNVGSAVAAWETLEDAATEWVELVALQEVKLSTSEYKSFDTRAAALEYACFGVPASNRQGMDGSRESSCSTTPAGSSEVVEVFFFHRMRL